MALLDFSQDSPLGGLLGYLRSRLNASVNDNGQNYNQPTPPLSGDAVRAYLAQRAATLNSGQDQYAGGYAQAPTPTAQAAPAFGAGATPTPYAGLYSPQQPPQTPQPEPQPDMVTGGAGNREVPTYPGPDTIAPNAALVQYQSPQQPVPQQPAPNALAGFGDRLKWALTFGNPAAQQNLIAQKLMAAKWSALSADPNLTQAQRLEALTNPEAARNLLAPPPPKTVEESIAREIGRAGGFDAAQGMTILNEMKKQQASSEALGKEQGTAKGNLPNAKATLDNAVQSIDELYKDPTLPQVVGGPIVGRNPGLTGKQEGTLQRIKQLEGQIVTNVMQGFRGTGIRLNLQEVIQLQRGASRVGEAARTQDLAGYKNALMDLRSQIVGMRTRLGEMAGGAPTPPPAAPTVDYRSYFGK